MHEEVDAQVSLWNTFCEDGRKLQEKFDGILSSDSAVPRSFTEIGAILSRKNEILSRFVHGMVLLDPIEEGIWFLDQAANVVELFNGRLSTLADLQSARVESPYAIAICRLRKLLSDQEETNLSLRSDTERRLDTVATLQRDNDSLTNQLVTMESRQSVLLQGLSANREETTPNEVKEIVSECERTHRLDRVSRYPRSIDIASKFYNRFKTTCENDNLVRDAAGTIVRAGDFALLGDDKCKILSAEPALYFSDKVVFYRQRPPFVKVPALVREIENGIKNNVKPGPIGKWLLRDAA